MEYDTLTFYRSRFFGSWRWRYQALGNGEKMANGGESYREVNMAIRSAFRVCGLPDAADFFTGPLRWTLVDRADGTQVMVRFDS